MGAVEIPLCLARFRREKCQCEDALLAFSHAVPHPQDCRSKLRVMFSSDEEIKLLEREKRAHCYPIDLLDRVLLSNPPQQCHKTCLGGLRVLIRLWNTVAVSEANGIRGSTCH